MKYNFLILLILLYALSFSINLIPAMKYPDSSLNIFNLLVTILFVVVLLAYSKKGNKLFKIFSMVGVISGVLVYVIKTFENVMFDYAILDAIASIQYPLYLIFTTPLFGGNMLFGLSYGTYSLLMSLLYGLVFVLMVTFNKKNSQLV